MRAISLQGVTLVNEAEAVVIIDYCLFSQQTLKAVDMAHPWLRKHLKHNNKQQPMITTSKCPLDDVVLWKYIPTQMAKQVTKVPTRNALALWQPQQGLSFPRGLCYLLAVQEHNWPSAMVELGYYPTVADLQCSHLVEKFSTFLVEQQPGLYHMKGQFV